MQLPIILHIPHSSKSIPDDVRSQFLLSDEELNRELIRFTDAYTDDLFEAGSNTIETIIYPVSRLVLDPERFLDDDKEPMAKKGFGVLYTLTSDGRELRKPLSIDQRNDLIERYYKAHHDRFNAIVRNHIACFGKSLIIDCHSYPSIPLPYESDQSEERPDICIGTDSFHTQEWLSERCLLLFKKFGYKTLINIPFSGSIVPGEFYRLNKNVRSIMIEVNRQLYMNEQTGLKNFRYENVKSNILAVLDDLITVWRLT